ncbi:Hypothetical protein GLP15_2484 [Giardia lamblia P15]|uniref:Uncharacterized protein n=1 Tax=Giardia intestinalis (strain P15) TaxID=658858 RepID=E1EWI2_GIAIA|nr:Hypothetical protein GLP15_2484 [Giardia lamblia P15]
MHATRLQHLCSRYGHQSLDTKKVSVTRPPAVNAGPSGLYDNYQRRRDQELMEEAIFMNTGLLPKAVSSFSFGYAHRHQAMASTGPSKGKPVTYSRPLAKSLPPDSRSSLKLSVHSHVQLPYKELDKLATSRAEEMEIDSLRWDSSISLKSQSSHYLTEVI